MGADTAAAFIRRHSDYELIIVGDNHQAFEKTIGRTTLISPGSMMRMSIEQKDHRPRVIIYDSDKDEGNRWRSHYLGVAPAGEVFSADVEEKKERDGRLDAYIEQMETGYEVGVSFERNLEKHLRQNMTKRAVREKIWKAVDG
jgi:hypothetical protein